MNPDLKQLMCTAVLEQLERTLDSFEADPKLEERVKKLVLRGKVSGSFVTFGYIEITLLSSQIGARPQYSIVFNLLLPKQIDPLGKYDLKDALDYVHNAVTHAISAVRGRE